MNCVKLSWALARQYEPAPASEDLSAPLVRLAYVTGFERMAEIAEQQLRATLEAHGFGMDEAWSIMHQWSKRIEALNDAMVEGAKSKAINALSELAISKILGLEKQCEKPTDKVEPKFHEGEWLCGNEPNNYARFIQILVIVNVQGKERYRISRDIHNDEDIVEFGFVENYYHKFGIKDARDGDVLVASDGSIFLFAGVDDCACRYYVALTADNYLKINKETKGGYWETSRAVHPATKKQRDLLFQKMADAGYEWDGEKKELKKIESKTLDAAKVIEWLKHCNITDCDMRTSTIPDSSPTSNPHFVRWFSEDFIEQFKKDFGLC